MQDRCQIPRRILCVHPNIELYGSDRTFIQSIKALRNGLPGISIDVVLPGKGQLSEVLKDIADNILFEPVWVVRKSSIRLRNAMAVQRLGVRVRSCLNRMQGYDFVYINTTVALDYILASKLSSTPSVIHVHELPNGVSRLAFSAILAAVRRPLIFNSIQTEKAFFLPTNIDKEVIHNGTPTVPISPVRQDRDKLNILLIGRFNSWKGQPLLVEATREIFCSGIRDIRVRLVGDVYGDQSYFKENVIKRVNKYNLEDFVEVLPFVADPTHHYEWADVVVVPSIKPEPFGLVAIEAMARARPVIAANHGGLLEIIKDRESGHFFCSGDAKDLAEKILLYFRNPDMNIAIGERAHSRFLESFEEGSYYNSIVNSAIRIFNKNPQQNRPPIQCT